MHHGLLCQTDETPDARELYAARLEACEDCVFLAATRGAPVAVPIDDGLAGDITWLVQAALGLEDQAESRRRPPMAAAPGAVRKLPRQG
jgi:hypothetical protein